MIVLKSLFKTPLTSRDALGLLANLIASPPLPKEMYEAAAGLVGKNGTSLLDFWRSGFKDQLTEITSERTWALQRSRLLRSVLVETGWRALFTSAKEQKHVEAWAHLVDSNNYFSSFPKSSWSSILAQRHLMAILSGACFLHLGTKAYRVDNAKALELDLYLEYYKEILLLDLRVQGMALAAVDQYEDAEASRIAEIKDEVINPLLSEQYRVLHLMADQIANATLEVINIKVSMDALQARKHEIARQFTSASL